ncbi:restriction endonuclease subunit S [Haemophilus influenzae]|uniref:restriction endonuclease subunit S n=1 Tax=Haemophilus influenzae TaxID=727 RepID=UPI0010A5709A|nr:restriction endonuclease subunit S [Haemophilus influenzae]
MSNLKEYRLGDCIGFIIDNRGKNPPLSDSGYELIETNMISSNNKYPDFDKVTKYVSEDTYNNWFRKGHPKIGDILISTVGNIGKVAIVNEDKGCIAQNLIGLRVNEKIIAEYLYYFLIKKDTQEQILSLNIGSVQPSIKVPHLLNLEIKIPELLKQKECIQVLSKLDDKIQLNTQINQTLEQIAQALFKSWFVDFDPVRAKVQALSDGMSLEQAELAAMQAISGKTPEELTALSQTQPDRYAELAETAKTFPCEMVEVDGVEVPKGWEIKPIELILDRLKNKQKLRKEEISFEGTIPVFEQGASILMGYHDKDAAFNASIDEPIFIFGDHTCITKLSTIPFSIYQNVIPLIGKNLPTYWVYCAIQNKQTFQEYRRHWAELIVKEVIVPDNINLCQCFSKKIKELFFKIDINHQENRSLIETRDLLLPRLLKGEI